MKAVLALAATVAVANAALMPRQLENIPTCALSCALSSLGNSGCDTSNFACICTANAFIAGLVPCVQKACSAAEYDATIKAAQGLCAGAGVTLSIPAGAVSTSAGASSAASSSAAETSAATTSAASETSSAASSAVTSAPSSSAVTSAPGSTTAAPTSSKTTNGTVSTTSPPQPTGTEPGAASRNGVALGGLGAVIALVAAFL